MKCYIKKIKSVILNGVKDPVAVLTIAGILLFPYSAHAGFLSFMENCTGNTAPSLSAFLYLFVQIAQWILGITGSLALLMFVVGGCMWLVSGGNEKMITMGKTTLINALIGLLIVFGSWMLIDFILKTVAKNTVYKGGGWYSFSSSLCNEPQYASIGAGGVGIPDAGPDRSAVEAGDFVPPPLEPSIIKEEQEKNSKKPAIKCGDAEKEKAACAQCEARARLGGKKAIGVILDYAEKQGGGEGEGEKCPPGKKRCDCVAEGIKCPASFNTATFRGECACGKKQTVLDSHNGADTTVKINGKDVPYMCCKCGKEEFEIKEAPGTCGFPLGSEAELTHMVRAPAGSKAVMISQRNPLYQCCTSARVADKGKRTCRSGLDPVKMDWFGTSNDCFCSKGAEGTPCVANQKEGEKTGCRGDSVCKTAAEEYSRYQKLVANFGLDGEILEGMTKGTWGAFEWAQKKLEVKLIGKCLHKDIFDDAKVKAWVDLQNKK